MIPPCGRRVECGLQVGDASPISCELIESPKARATRERSVIHFVVHDEDDSVGVVVVEGVKAGQRLEGWIMDQDKSIEVTARSDIPIGHKLAIRPLENGTTVIKYGVDIGRTIAPIAIGEHTHVQNLRTKRW
jgi:(2R)-sulfolactate sulfo-lyase subunit alpha